MYRHKTYKDQPLFNSLIQKLKDSGLGAYWITETDDTKPLEKLIFLLKSRTKLIFI